MRNVPAPRTASRALKGRTRVLTDAQLNEAKKISTDYFRSKGHHGADDLVQDVLVGLWKMGASGVEVRNLRGATLTVSQRVFNYYLRGVYREAENREKLPPEQVYRQRYLTVPEGTPQDTARLLFMILEGKTYSQIADHLGVSIDDVKNILRRLKKK